LLDPWRVSLKRSIELAIIILFSPVLLLLVISIAILIKLTSRGPVFYGHERIGLGGKRFKAWKFRSMIKNADQTLTEGIQDQPRLQSEWQHRQKLKRDPRVTPIGRILRRTSLDELPQIWNVLRGQMSLVGPRPIVENEIPKYGEQFALFTRVRPGMTGLWQVSGRNNLPYSERVRLDIYYVRNWSVWLDLHLLSRTIIPVLFGDGAY
jgi:Undecaprenyl-phosphate galactose phosphotransferase WbaP